MIARASLFHRPALVLCILLLTGQLSSAQDYDVIDTGQVNCYDNSTQITPPSPGQPFHGQDAQFDGVQFAFQDNGDGTVTDLETGLMWQQTPSSFGYTWQEAVNHCNALTLAGHGDWRIPSLKEQFSISDFSQGWPYVDTTYFNLAGPVVSKDEQYWTSNFYVGLTHGGQPSAFGVNHGTGHIKAYPAGAGGPMGNYVRAVRGDSYGANAFVDNGDGTVIDTATGLMWQTADSGIGLDWEDALLYAGNQNTAGHQDWRLPNIKELQSIVDYTRSPNAANPANLGPAIDTSFFDITQLPAGTTNHDPDYGYFWSSTSAYFGPQSPPYYYGWYVAFGTAPDPLGDDTHGAGAVRFDTKVEGGPAGEGGERYYNYVRCVRGPAWDGSPDVYCTAKLNSQTCTPEMAFSGVPSVSDPNPFDLTASGIVASKDGLLFYGTSAYDKPFQGGWLCVLPPIKRTAVQNAGGFIPCEGTFGHDFNALIQGGGDPNLVVDAEVFAQYWYRDPADPAGYGSGLTDACRFRIQP